jgi:carboxypeptidase family protein/TonB-dependent receptor-like protein
MRSSMKACGMLLAALYFLVPSHAMAQSATTPPSVTIRGRVTDSESRSPIDLAEVVVVGTARRAFTDDKGRFVLEGIAPGTYTLSVNRMGYAPFRRELVASEGSESALELQLTRTAIPLKEVTVTPGSFSFMGQGVGVRQTMSREDVDAVPQIGDDIFRAVNRLPGLVSNDYSAHFGIRGGRHDETLILLDGLELFEPYHLKDFNEGAVSIIDANTIDGVQLMTGGFPARYGNRRSGVFDIQSRTPEPDKTQFDVGSSFLNTHAMAMGSFGKGKGTWLAFGRVGYLGLMFKLLDQADLPKPQYEDVFAKASYKLTPTQELSFDVLHAGDRYKYDIPATTGFLDTISTREVADNTYGNSYAWTTLKSAFGTNLSARTMLSGGLVKRDRNGYERAITSVAPFYAVSNQRKYTTFGVAQDWTLGLSERDIVTFGADVRRLRNTDANRATVYQDPDDPEPPPPGEFPILTNTTFRASGTRLGFYLSNRWRVARPLVLETGVRYDRATWTGDSDYSPRTSAALDLGRGMTLRLGWGFYRQMQNIDDVAALNGSTTFYPSELSEQWTAGWDRTGGKGSQLRIEGYFKRGSHLRPVFRNWKGAVDAFPEPNEDRILVFPRDNTSKGVEVYFDRPIGKSVTARASYSYAIANEDVVRIDNVNSGDPLTYDLSHPGPQDQRHAANADFTYRVGSYTLNGSFAYHSGWPATLEHLVPVINDNGDPDSAVRPSKLYGARLPDYMRLDMRASRKWPTHLGDFGASLEVINLTNHANVFGYDYFKHKLGAGQVILDRGDEQWFTIMPALGLTWSRSF